MTAAATITRMFYGTIGWTIEEMEARVAGFLADHDAALAAAVGEQYHELLLRHGFERILCGFDGKSYYECKECHFYVGGHEHAEGRPELAKHKEDCALYAAIRALPPFGAPLFDSSERRLKSGFETTTREVVQGGKV